MKTIENKLHEVTIDGDPSYFYALDWCNKNIQHHLFSFSYAGWEHQTRKEKVCFHFKNENDAVLFKLMWG